MAKRPRRKRNDKVLQQARQIVDASLQPKSTIRRQYGRAIRDTAGFTDALLAELRAGSGAVTGAYAPAIAQQRGIHDQAVAALQGLGPQYAGAGIATGAMGDSATTHLLESQANAGAYAAKLPGIAAGRGALQKQGLVQGRQEALEQRAEQFRAQLPALVTQLRQQQFDRNMALRSFNEGRRQFNVGQRNAQSQFEQTMAFNRQGRAIENQHFRQQMIAQYGFDPITGRYLQSQGNNLAGSLGMNPKEFQAFQEHTVTQMENMLAGGASYQQVQRRAQAVGVPPKMARALAAQVYANAPEPAKPDLAAFQRSVGSGSDRHVETDRAGYNAALRAYERQKMVIRWFNQRWQRILTNRGRPAGRGRPMPRPH